MNNKLIVCTEAASFMGGAFDTKEMSEKSHSQAFQLSKKYGGVTNNNKTKICVYKNKVQESFVNITLNIHKGFLECLNANKIFVTLQTRIHIKFRDEKPTDQYWR